jgi:hypothetical protein
LKFETESQIMLSPAAAAGQQPPTLGQKAADGLMEDIDLSSSSSTTALTTTTTSTEKVTSLADRPKPVSTGVSKVCTFCIFQDYF